MKKTKKGIILDDYIDKQLYVCAQRGKATAKYIRNALTLGVALSASLLTATIVSTTRAEQYDPSPIQTVSLASSHAKEEMADLEQRLSYKPEIATQNHPILEFKPSDAFIRDLYLQIKGKFKIRDLHTGAINLAKYSDMIKEECGETIDYITASSIVLTESNADPNAVSRAGAEGLMMLMPITSRSQGLNPSQRKDPRLNVRAGLKEYNDLLEKFNGDKNLALAAYNFGETNINNVFRRNRESNKIWDNLRYDAGVPLETKYFIHKIRVAGLFLEATEKYGIMPVIKGLQLYELKYKDNS